MTKNYTPNVGDFVFHNSEWWIVEEIFNDGEVFLVGDDGKETVTLFTNLEWGGENYV